MLKVPYLATILLSLFLISGCSNDTTKQQLIITGSSTIAPLASELARAFEKAHPNTEIDIQSGGSSRGINDARQELAQIGMVSRALKANEADLYAYPIAYDGVTVITNNTNPISQLSNEQIVKIYQGEIKNWAQVGGPDQTIVVVNKAEGRSTLELFLKFFKLKNSDIKADVVIGDNQQGLKTIAGNPWAIGYVSIGSAEYDLMDGKPIRLLSLAGIPASTASVKDGSFPLSRSLNLVTKEPPSGLIMQFIDFARSQETRMLVEKQFFIPIDA